METERCVMRVRSEETGSQTDLVQPRVEEEELNNVELISEIENNKIE